MRNKTILIALALLAVSLTACGTKAPPYTVDDARRLLDAGVFDGDMMRAESAAVLSLYGVDEEKVVDCVSFLAADTAVSFDEVTVFVLTDAEAAATVRNALLARVKSQIANAKVYCPAAVPRLEAAVVDQVDNTVLLAVGDPDTLPDAVGSLHK